MLISLSTIISLGTHWTAAHSRAISMRHFRPEGQSASSKAFLPSQLARGYISRLTSHRFMLTCLSSLSSPSRYKWQNIDSVQFASGRVCCARECLTLNFWQFMAKNYFWWQILNLSPHNYTMCKHKVITNITECNLRGSHFWVSICTTPLERLYTYGSQDHSTFF